VTINAVKTWIRADELAALRTPGGHHRIAEGELAAFQARLLERSRRPARIRSRVLIVDDDPLLLEALQETLGRATPDILVEVATDGYEALVEVGRFRPDVLALDLRMPRLDGFEVCQRLKGRAATRDVRILAMTAFTEVGSRDRILAAGADDFLEKPFDLDTFQARIMALCRREERR
jgi:DNA-binding response OmpR family regulator